jgi:thiamine-phosphate pyrophosphorylase
MNLPRLYAILDVDLLSARSLDLKTMASEWLTAGVELLQYRNKTGADRVILNDMSVLRDVFATVTASQNPADTSPNRSHQEPETAGHRNSLKLILNDRVDLALLSGADGVHLGQEDMSAEDARRILGRGRWIGVSTHTPAQIAEADRTDCDYVAYGPIFATQSKQNPDPIVGLDGLRQARRLTRKPLVAIGGITQANCRSVFEAGADSAAIISALLPGSREESAREIAKEFLALLG